jgi:hypothetical protein
MRIAYIAGPYRAATKEGIDANIERARDVAIKWWKRGYAAICPQANSAHMDGEVPDEVFLEGTMEMMRRADVVVMMDGWLDSKGAVAELIEARKLGKDVLYDSLV